MSIIYNRVYRVPVWVIVNLPADQAKEIVKAFDEHGALSVKWPDREFLNTVAGMGSQGWREEVTKERPFFVSVDFMKVAVKKHLTVFGANKSLSGTPDSSWSRMNRKIETDEDYVRLFNDIMSAEPDVLLSHLFSIGELCHQAGREQVKTFITVGPAPLKVLQKVSDNVITVGDSTCDINVTGEEVKDKGLYAVDNVARRLGLIE